ncbi:MAG: hypothetical protein REH83_07365, partial [Rickettsiella sp.]|nr:hypothetical protein [Rickettsiella sp.]
YACALGGLFNRLGSSVDGTRLPQEKKAILFGIFLGFIFALSLIAVLAATGTLPLVAVAGISKVFFDLFVLHKTLFTFTFIFSITSLSASFFDYFAKAICFFKYKYHLGVADNAINERLQSRYHEYRGAFLGLPIACVLALGIVTSLVFSCGLVTAPFAVIATMIITFITCSSVISALFSRIGRVIDGIERVSSLAEKKTDDGQYSLTSEQNGTLNNRICHSNAVSLRKCNSDELPENKVLNHSKIKTEIQICDEVFIEQHQNTERICTNKNDNAVCLQDETYSHRVLLIHLGKKSAAMFGEPKDSPKFTKYRRNNASFFQTKEEKASKTNFSKFTLANLSH